MSDRTAIRIGGQGSSGAPRPSAACRWIARIAVGDASGAGGDDDPMPVQPGDLDRDDLEVAAAQVADRATGGRQLVGEVAALPGEERSAGSEERERELDELGQSGPRPGQSPTDHVARRRPIGRDRLRPGRLDRHAVAEPGVGHRDLEEAGLLGDRLDER